VCIHECVRACVRACVVSVLYPFLEVLLCGGVCLLFLYESCLYVVSDGCAVSGVIFFVSVRCVH